MDWDTIDEVSLDILQEQLTLKFYLVIGYSNAKYCTILRNRSMEKEK
jgi:hypothetical protein